jgi:hypothetical protein
VSGRRIPPARTQHCEQCGTAVDTAAPDTRRAVRGFVRPRTAGGANAIELREDLDVWLCRFCTDQRKRGHAWVQLDLFGGET